jgi:hypothetical protein
MYSREVTVKLSLCLTNYALHHEGVWGSGCIEPYFLDLSTSWRFLASAALPTGKIPGTHWIGGWVSPRAGLDTSELELRPLGRSARRQSLDRLH